MSYDTKQIADLIADGGTFGGPVKKTSTSSSPVVPPMTAKARKDLTDASDVGADMTYTKAKKVKKDKDLSGEAQEKDRQERQTKENIETASSNLDNKITSGVNKGKTVREITGSSFRVKDDGTTMGGFNKGGLMAKKKKKK